VSAIKTIGVVGAGQMGQGIVQVAAQAGLDVVLVDVEQKVADAGVAKLGKSWDKLGETGKLTADAASAARARVKAAGDHAALSGCELVVEAAPENEALKLAIFKSLAAATPATTILASNTSSISITKLAAASGRPERFIGMHFMNPVPVMKLVEVIRGLGTSDETMATTLELAKTLGKTTIVARDVPGFIVNRILIPMLNEACFALYEGLGTAADIDTGCQLGLAHPLGPLALADLIGLDTCLAIAEVLHTELGDSKYRPAPILRQYVDAGWLGRKTGRGFHTY
jgi:3-hydroxybutyryl-CoA dehydrogenase